MKSVVCNKKNFVNRQKSFRLFGVWINKKNKKSNYWLVYAHKKLINSDLKTLVYFRSPFAHTSRLKYKKQRPAFVPVTIVLIHIFHVFYSFFLYIEFEWNENFIKCSILFVVCLTDEFLLGFYRTSENIKPIWPFL